MAKFMFVYRESEFDSENASPEEMQTVFQNWMTWIKGGMEAGWMVAPGDALKPEGKVVKSGEVVTDGPFTESKELIGGYSLVEAADLDAASKLTKGCPVFEVGGCVEVRELMDIPAPE
ncbi:YciI family protein [Mariniblastus fucicola]|uniref:YCII-related domain protein n=1 Tax=Mariniblastus fucicola TaxID=980251 RepID=A0A5B9PBR7_9BACT|nr:YciI family protein [Mariniblastus fucicola]QEG24167.1 YCII-related domain protein [Mariniblastus fucicola]